MNKKQFIIYKITNLINNKWYIGQSSSGRNHYYGSGKLLKLAIVKYGKKNFKKEILELLPDGSDKEDLNKAEIKWIKTTNAVEDPNSYNLSPGGEAITKDSKIADAVSKGWSKGRIFIAKDSNGKEVYRGYNKAECCRLLSLHITNVIKCLHLKRASVSGYTFLYIGETRSFIPGNGLRRKVINKKTGQIFNSITEAARFYNTHKSGIDRALKYGTPHLGFNWEYA